MLGQPHQTIARGLFASPAAVRRRRHAAGYRPSRQPSRLCSLQHPVCSPTEEAARLTRAPAPVRLRPTGFSTSRCGMLARFAGRYFEHAAKGTRVPLPVIHVAAYTPGIVAACFAMRYICDGVLRLVAGLVAIFGRDKQSRASRALAVLRAIPRPRKQQLCG